MNKRNTFSFGVAIITTLAILSALLLSACGAFGPDPTPSPTPTPEPTPTPTPRPETSMTRIQDKGELVVAVEAAHPPYIYVNRNNGLFEYYGPEYELVKAIADDLGVTLVLKDTKVADMYVGLNMGIYDLAIANITPNETDREEVNFSDIYFKDEYPIIILKENADKFYDDRGEDNSLVRVFKDERVCVIRKTVQAKLVEEALWYPKLQKWKSEAEMIDKLLTGYFAGVCLEPYRARYYINKFPDLGYSGIVLTDENASGHAVAIAKDKEDLTEYVNSMLTTLQDDSFMLKKLGITETDYDSNSLDIDTACADYLGILYGK
ncbi:MAG: transporter substrate-binding domain-containing protein [Eubacteriales bacterium]